MLSEAKSSSDGAKKKFLHCFFYILSSFILGFLFVVFLIAITGAVMLGKNLNPDINQKKTSQIPFARYEGSFFSLDYPENYELYENKIIATEGIVDNQKNTVQLISPPLNKNAENLSMIIAFMPYQSYLEKNKKNQSTTCPALYERKLDQIIIGEKTFTTSGQIFCGPNEVAFFYLLKNNYIYEVKAESSADYESEALPEIKKILRTIKFKEK